MRVTVITPSLNQGGFIGDCLRSVHAQTHRDIEHLVTDGLSNDGTAQIAAGFPCSFFESRDSGPAQAINRGLELATGDIVCWLNTDDAFWSPRTLERVVQLFEELPGVDVITGNGYYMDEVGRLAVPIGAPANRFCLPWLKRVDSLLQPATFWRRNAIRLDESLAYVFDWKLWIEFWEAGLNFAYVPEYFGLYRLHAGSLTQTDSARRRKELLLMATRFDGRKMQIAWCWLVWKAFVLAEATRSRGLKRFAVRWNSRMKAATGGRIGSF
jgi:glycosyltransferase involved in cell wall biosynthesis